MNETLETDPSSEAITRLDLEYLNIFYFFEQVLQRPDYPLDLLFLLYGHLATYLTIRGMASEKVNWGVDLFERYKQVRRNPPPALFDLIGSGHAALGSYDEAIKAYNVMLEFYSDEISEADLAAVHFNLSRIYLDKGDVMEAARHCKFTIESDERRGNRRGLAMALSHLSVILRDNGQREEGLRIARRALEIAREIDNAHLIAHMTASIAEQMDEQASLEEIISVFEEALRLLEARNDEVGIASTSFNYALQCANGGQLEKARALLERSLEIYERYDASEAQQVREFLTELESDMAGDTA